MVADPVSPPPPTRVEAQKQAIARAQLEAQRNAQQERQQQEQTRTTGLSREEATAEATREAMNTQQNQAVTSFYDSGARTPDRNIAPGAATSQSRAAIAARADALKNQAYKEGGYTQEAGTKDQFSSAREAALTSGSFSYGSQQAKDSAYSPPQTYVDKYGNIRTSIPSSPATVTTSKIINVGKTDLGQAILTQADKDFGTTALYSPNYLQGLVLQGKITGQEYTNILAAYTAGQQERSSASGLRNIETIQQQKENALKYSSTKTTPGTPEPLALEQISFAGGTLKSNLSKQEARNLSYSDKVNSALRQNLANVQDQASKDLSGTQGTEAVPFLSARAPVKLGLVSVTTEATRGRGAKPTQRTVIEPSITDRPLPEGTKEIPYTSILDVLQFAPIGGLGLGGARAALMARGTVTGVIKTSGGIYRTVSGLERVGGTVIEVPKGITPKEETLAGKLSSLFGGKTTEPTPTEPLFSSQEVSLGKGLGKSASEGKGAGSISGGGKPTGSTPGETPRTVSAGKGLEQIVKEKEEIKPTSKTESITKQEQIEKTVTKNEPERERAMNEYKQGLKKLSKSDLETTPLILVKPPGPKTTQTPGKPKQRETPVPILVPLTVPAPPPTKPKQQENILITDLVTTKVGRESGSKDVSVLTDTTTAQVTRGQTKQNLETPLITDSVYTERGGGGETGGGFGGLGGGNPGILEKVSKSGARKQFEGNVPELNIVGVYKRDEISYSQKVIRSSEREQSDQALGKFVSSGKRSETTQTEKSIRQSQRERKQEEQKPSRTFIKGKKGKGFII